MATSQSQCEARQRAHGGGDATERKLNLGGDLGDYCGVARMVIRSRIGGREFGEAVAAI